MSAGQPPELGHLTSIPLGGPPPAPVALRGRGLDGTAVAFDPNASATPSLLLFLGGHCDGCASLAGLLDGEGLPGGLAVVGVLPDAGHPKGQGLEAFAGRRAPLLRSPQAFVDYRVTAPPFFTLVSAAPARVLAEGVPLGPGDLVAEVERALG